jgi:hypothetical protein
MIVKLNRAFERFGLVDNFEIAAYATAGFTLLKVDYLRVFRRVINDVLQQDDRSIVQLRSELKVQGFRPASVQGVDEKFYSHYQS